MFSAHSHICHASAARKLTVVLVAVGLFLAWSSPVAALGAEDPELVHLDSTVAGRELQASLQLLDAFDEPTRIRLEAGLPTSFTYHFKLETKRRWWFDPTDVTSKLDVIAVYDAIDREYQISYMLDGRLVQSKVAEDLRALERAMTVIGPISIFELDGKLRMRLGSLEEGKSVLRARAVIGSRAWLGIIPTSIGSQWLETAVPVNDLSLPQELEPARPSLFQ